MRDAVNIQAVGFVAEGLQELRERMVFVGGAVISLYADDPGADLPRPTSDIDMVIELAGYAAYAHLEERLAALGFRHSPEDRITCRYRYHGVVVDIMPTDVPSVAPANPWYLPGLPHATEQVLPNGIPIKLLPAPHFLGTKFAAFHGRGTDPRTSKDFEDIVYLLDGRLGLVDEVAHAPDDIRTFLAGEARQLLEDPHIREFLLGHLSPLVAVQRMELVLEKLRSLARN